MTNARTALIIGGGIAGPVTAMALQRVGIQATIYEAYATSADGIGGAMMIAPNGLNAMRIIGVDDAVRSVGVPTPQMVMETGAGKLLGVVKAFPGLPISQTVARGDLYEVLNSEAKAHGITIEYGKRLVRITDTGDQVTAHFADGTTATADILIGADGIRSTVRAQIDPTAPQPRYQGLLGFGGWACDTGLASTGGAMHFVFGKRAFLGYQVADDGRTMWFCNLPHAEPLTGAQARAIPAAQWLRELTDRYRGDTSPAVTILSRVREDELICTGALEDIPTVPTWHAGRVVLVGDSAHATSPSSGQGASLAAESAIQLARCLRDLPVEQAFTAYVRLRRARVERVIAGAARINNDKAAGPVGRLIRDLVFPVAMRTFYTPERMFGWMYRHTIDWDARVDG